MGSLYKRGDMWWIKYYQNGKPIRESTGMEKDTEAKRFLKLREGQVAQGKRVVPHFDRLRFEELATDLLADYQINGKRSQDKAQRSIKHLKGFFGGMRAIDITTYYVRRYIAKQQEVGYSNAEINRELAALKRMFNLARQQTPPKVDHVPYIPILQEDNVRSGFFEPEAFRAVLKELPGYLKPVATFAYYTSWRKEEILNLMWGQVDLEAGTVRLEPGTTKNREGRTVFLPTELYAILRELRTKTTTLERERGQIYSLGLSSSWKANPGLQGCME
jgi:integrase